MFTFAFLRLWSLPLSLSLILTLSCAPARQDMVVATVGDSDISLGEYENLYLKTSTNREDASKSTLEDREKFLDLLTNFRLKLMDAYDMKLDKNPEIISEMDLYKGSLATSFLVEREVMRPGVRKLYDERRTEYRASHILLNLPPSASSADSATAYTKAMELISRTNGGEDFGALAVEFSQDPSAKENRGDLYYFTSGQMVRPIEEAVQSMQIGEVRSQPVRTQHGLHILKLVDRKPAPGEIRVSHLMTRFSGPDATPEDTARAFSKIEGIRDSLSMGKTFADLARRNSEDPGSGPNGGDLGWFGRRRWVQEFDEAAFRLQTGQTSGIVRSRYGYHLIHCTDSHQPKTFEESEKDVQKLYEQLRFEEDKQAYVKKLKQETAFSFDETAFKTLISELDTNSTMKNAAWADSVSPATLGMSIMRFGERGIPIDSTIKVLKQRSDLQTTPLRPGSFRGAVDKVGDQFVFTVKSETIDRQYPEFRSLMKEYMDGILLYQIEQEKIWNSISVSDSSVRAYFEANREKFNFPDRVDFSEIRASTDSVARAFHARLTDGATFRELAVEDSIRMSKPNNHPLIFSQNSTKLSTKVLNSLKTVDSDLSTDPKLRVHLIAHPDTSGGKSGAATLADKRLARLKDRLVKKLGVPGSSISTFVRHIPANIRDKEERKKLNNQIDADIVGRATSVVGKIERQLSAFDADERSKQASRLKPGEVSNPFRFKNGYSIVLHHRTEPARNKTFEEAGTEVSSAYQEYESKRLEQVWLDGLKKRYPVTEDPEVLQKAFTSAE